MCQPTNLKFLTVYVPITEALLFIASQIPGNVWTPKSADYIGLIRHEDYKSGAVSAEDLLALVVFDVRYENDESGTPIPVGHVPVTIVSDRFEVKQEQVRAGLRHHIRTLANAKGLPKVRVAANEPRYTGTPSVAPDARSIHYKETAVVLSVMSFDRVGGGAGD